MFVQGSASQPTPLLEGMAAGGVDAIEFIAAFIPGLNTFDLTAIGPQATATLFYPTPQHRAAIMHGRACYRSMHHSEIGPYLTSLDRVDALLVQVAPPDDQGRCSLGVSVDFVPLLADRVPIIIAEVNARMPRVPDAPWLPRSRLTYTVATDRPLPEFPDPSPDDATERLAKHAASLIEDGDCLQAGIGRVPSAVLRRLQDRRDLGIHTGLFGDAFADLVIAGAATGNRKTRDIGLTVAGLVAGSARTYALAAEGRIALRAPQHTHDVEVIGSIDRFVSINAALEVDLLGQVNAESADGRVVSGAGGFVDFVRGARRSRGGRSIVLVPAAARSATRSRIVAALTAGTAVTCARTDVDMVVTEYGIARLRHASIDERAQALIAVAAPAFRDRLTEEWRVLRRGHYG